jgi:ketosteroid isomerase-like protein
LGGGATTDRYTMKRREFIGATAMAIAATLSREVQADDAVPEFKRIVVDYYKVYYTDLDRRKYRSMLTDDYVLLEDGDIVSLEKDISLMPTPQDDYQRKDTFDFRSVKIQKDVAYLVYFLKSDIRDKQEGARRRAYLESMILRRDSGGTWRVALLHSTKLSKP